MASQPVFANSLPCSCMPTHHSPLSAPLGSELTTHLGILGLLGVRGKWRIGHIGYIGNSGSSSFVAFVFCSIRIYIRNSAVTQFVYSHIRSIRIAIRNVRFAMGLRRVRRLYSPGQADVTLFVSPSLLYLKYLATLALCSSKVLA